MKILHLFCKNLNSLYGSWNIDFTCPEYMGNGIFALTGPTGAGKSTVLDAISLALYGETPRLGKITSNNNEIMSRQTGECIAEVVFSCSSGKFRCHFSQRRARGAASGVLQPARHEISRVVDGKILAESRKKTLVLVEEKTGMDFTRFTRSTLLAQGGFDAFLSARAEEKSEILEQITGSEIYSEVSRCTYERFRREKESLTRLEVEVGAIPLLDEESRCELDEKHHQARRRMLVIAARCGQTEQALRWRKNVDDLEEELLSLDEKKAVLDEEKAAFASSLLKLQDALRVAVLDGDYARLASVRKQRATDLATKEKKEKMLPALLAQCAEKENALREAVKNRAEAVVAQKETAPLLNRIRLLDAEIATKKEGVESFTKQLEKECAAKDLLAKNRKEAIAAQKDAQKRFEALLAWMQHHDTDMQLVSELTGFEEQWKNLATMRADLHKRSNQLDIARQSYRKAEKKLTTLCKSAALARQQQKKFCIEIERKKAAVTTLLAGRNRAELMQEQEHLQKEVGYLRKIVSLEQERRRLLAGQPCPLCGAISHPFVDDLPVEKAGEEDRKLQELTALLTQIDALQEEVRLATVQEKLFLANVAAEEKKEGVAAAELTAQKCKGEDLAIEENQLRQRIQQIEDKFIVILNGYGLQDKEDPGQFLTTLRKRQQRWQQEVEKKEKQQKQLEQAKAAFEQITTLYESSVLVVKQKKEELAIQQKSLMKSSSRRQELFGSRNADREEEALQKRIEQAVEKEQLARNACDTAKQQQQVVSSEITMLCKALNRSKEELFCLEGAFIRSLAEQKIANEEQFCALRLSAAERDALATSAADLQKKEQQLTTRIADCHGRLSKNREQLHTSMEVHELEPLLMELLEEQSRQHEEAAAIFQQLNADKENRRRIAHKNQAMAMQQKECERFRQLNTLIGSSDGKKFRNFAQGLTFELMVDHANRQLQTMNERYLLLRDTKQPLALNVVDLYQAGEVRPVGNLSGGESFMVSLALALGLARMAGSRAQVDSLFLDEGFGTLDEEALEMALSALAALQQDGKLVGVISHVGALQERIASRIDVVPKSGGRSILCGVGVTQVSS